MSTHKYIDKICVVAIILSMLLSAVFMNGKGLGTQSASKTIGYEGRLFDTSAVHTIDIVMDDWDGFIETCKNEEYSACTVVIDGESYKNVGIRGKGNTSLSSVASMNSNRYSFKIEFDQYDNTKSYHGLDKLSLNNIIQDNTYMKDYLTYQMMGQFGLASPLCSYVYVTINGEDWGLYLAVEGVEDSFLQRNYGSDYGELYKPDSMSFGGGKGHGMDFDMDDFMNSEDENDSGDSGSSIPDINTGPGGQGSGNMPPGMGSSNQAGNNGTQMPGAMNPPSTDGNNNGNSAQGQTMPSMPGGGAGNGGMSMGGRGSSDVKLQYIDDDADSYSNIFNSAKTNITESDEKRLIASLKSLSEGDSIEEVVDIEKVIRYFVVHNFVVNGDSYTGSMVHNYYLYEKDGLMSMIPWDYNLAFGTFQASSATDAVNAPIDSPVSGGSLEDRPMVAWIFDSEEYIQLYHEYFSEFLEAMDLEDMIDTTAALIGPYVEKDPTKFCTYEEFEAGYAALKDFCSLREESIEGQLAGTIPSTSEGQTADSSALVDASAIKLSAMGSFSGGGMGGNRPGGNGEGYQQQNGEQGGTSDLPSNGGGVPQQPGTSEGNTTATPPKGGMGSMPGQNGGGGMQQPPSGQGSGTIPEKPGGNGQSGTTQMPNGTQMQGRPGGGSVPNMNSAGGPGASQAMQSNTQAFILLGVSVAVLLVGLVIAIKYRRRKG